MVLVDMIADRNLGIRRDSNSTKWLTDIVWDAAARLKLDALLPAAATTVEDDHLPFLAAGVPSVDIIDLDYDAWHTQRDTLDAVSARSLQVVGDVVLAALPQIEAHLRTSPPRLRQRRRRTQPDRVASNPPRTPAEPNGSRRVTV